MMMMMNVAYKIFTDILAQCFEVYTEENLGEYQCGFRQAWSTTDHVFTMRQILEISYEYNITLHQLYIDFKHVFDRIDQLQIIESMEESGIPAKLITLTKMTVSRTHIKVKIQNKLEVSEQNVVSDKVIPCPPCCLILAWRK
jgi:hypothetical protein